jgi:hypothetical protein
LTRLTSLLRSSRIVRVAADPILRVGQFLREREAVRDRSRGTSADGRPQKKAAVSLPSTAQNRIGFVGGSPGLELFKTAYGPCRWNPLSILRDPCAHWRRPAWGHSFMSPWPIPEMGGNIG